MNAAEPRRTRTKKELLAREKTKLEVQRLNGKKT